MGLKLNSTATCRILLPILFLATTVSCANKVLKYENVTQLQEHSEFDKAVKIEETSVADAAAEDSAATNSSPAVDTTSVKDSKNSTDSKKSKDSRDSKDTKSTKKSKKVKKITLVLPKGKKVKTLVVPPAEDAAPTRRQPELESDVGFNGRRPLKDPFRVGEKVVHSVRYFKVSAGELTMGVNPFVKVNGVKSYKFVIGIQTSSMFSSFYAADDRVETLVDYESLVPSVFTMHLKETGQIKESRSYFDHKTMRAKFWEKKVTEKSGREEKHLEWDLAPYAQNVFSAAFYMRNFKWDVGTVNAFVVSDDEKNLIFKGTGIRKETLETEAGTFKAIVIKPEITLKDKFQPIGDVFIWLSDDDRKYILRIESKIKIGTLVSEIVKLEPGHD